MSGNWGDIPLVPDPYSGIAAIELEQLTKIKPLDMEIGKLFQPIVVDHGNSGEEIDYMTPDTVTCHTIDLINHYKKVKQLLLTAQQQEEKAKKTAAPGPSSLPPAPPLPELPECILKHRRPGDISGRSKEALNSDFMKGECTPPPELTQEIAKGILWYQVAIMLNHVGFDSGGKYAINLLTDVAQQYIKKTCKLLRVNVDDEYFYGAKGFADVLERTFQDIGFGSITSLHSWYQSRIIDYYEHVLKSCHDIRDEYEKLRVPVTEVTPVPEDKPKKIQEEASLVIQFPVTEEAEENQHETQSQIPLQLEEFQGALQNIEPDGTTTLKDEESMKWPLGQTKKDNISQYERESAANLNAGEDMLNVNDSPERSTTREINISSPILETVSSPVASRSIKVLKKTYMVDSSSLNKDF